MLSCSGRNTRNPETGEPVHGLTLYDAAYLEVAIRRGLPLASLDAELRAAAQTEGVALLGK